VVEKNFKQERKVGEDILALVSGDDVEEILVPVFVDEILSVVGNQCEDIITLNQTTISNEMKNWKVFIDTCLQTFPSFILILFDHLLNNTKPSATISEWKKYILTAFTFTKPDTLILLKLCFENSQGGGHVKECLRIIKSFKSMPEDGHRYHTLIKYILGFEDVYDDEDLQDDTVKNQIEIVNQKLQSNITLVDTALTNDTTLTNSKWTLTQITCQVGQILPDEDLDLDFCYDDLKYLNDNNMLFIPVDKVQSESDGGCEEVEMDVDHSKLMVY
jgi:hypothetical protein